MDTNQELPVLISGAGPVGCLAACYLAKRGYPVEIFESRADSRNEEIVQGRSINLAVSNRAFEAMRGVDPKYVDDIHAEGIKMFGRCVHLKDGSQSFQFYGKPDEYILSVGRRFLNEYLTTRAEQFPNVKIHFNDGTKKVNLKNTSITTAKNGEVKGQFIIGADGLHSPVRRSIQEYSEARFQFQQKYMTHSYKELILLPKNGEHAMRADSLHIWPREDFMLIALPNPTKDFTVTLFLRTETDPSKCPYSFENLNSDEKVLKFFRDEFSDYLELAGEEAFLQSWHENPTSGLAWVKTYPHHFNKCLLIGDAGHAIIPFYGQGVNCGLEDCRVLDGLWDAHQGDVEQIFNAYSKLRKPATDAICELAEYNFIEMAALTASQAFALKKKIGMFLYKLMPNKFIPLYTMVTFSPHISYDVAWKTYRDREAALSTAATVVKRGTLLAAISGLAYYGYRYYCEQQSQKK